MPPFGALPTPLCPDHGMVGVVIRCCSRTLWRWCGTLTCRGSTTKGITALMRSAGEGHDHCTEELLAAGAPPPGSPPRWAPVGPSAVVSAAHEPGRVGCRLWGVGAAFWCPKWPVPLSRLFGGGLESPRNPLKSVGSASGWCGVGHHHVPAKCARGYPRKRPGSTPNPKSGLNWG